MNARTGGRQILLQGMALVFVGLVWGFVVPAAPFPRLALTAHIQLESNGLLLIVLALLMLTLPHRVGSKSIAIMLLSVGLTWIMVLSEMANAWWGTHEILPIAAAQAGATGGASWQEQVVTLAHMASGLGLLIAWLLLIVGFVRPIDQAGTTDSAT